MSFIDRRDAGVQLGLACQRFSTERPLVLGLVRGGIPVAYEVAKALQSPLDALGVRKIGMPGQPELALGAISEDDVVLIDPEMQAWAGITESAVQRFVDDARAALAARMETIRDAVPLLAVRGRTVIVVDDGIATGATMRAALEVVRARDAARIIVATPVAAEEALDRCRHLVDDVVCLLQPASFGAVGQWYEQFGPTTDAEVVELLRLQRSVEPGPEPVDQRPLPLRVETEVQIPIEGTLRLPGEVLIPERARALVVFAHGSGSNRLSPRNRFVAQELAPRGYASLRLDLLTPDETLEHENSFAFPLLASRVRRAIDWAIVQPALRGLPIVVYGASTGAAVALIVAATDRRVRGVISRGGRGDLASEVLDQVRVPSLFLIGSRDDVVFDLTEPVIRSLGPRATLEVIPGASHLFEEPRALEAVCERTAAWLDRQLRQPASASAG